MALDLLVAEGTITLEQGSMNVVGVGTNWLYAGVRERDVLLDATTGQTSYIESVSDDNNLTLIQPWAHAAGVGNSFTIIPQGHLSRVAELHALITKYLAAIGEPGLSGVLGYSLGLPSDAVGLDGEFRLDFSTFILYQKQNGAWAAGGSIKGADGKDAYQEYLDSGSVGSRVDFLLSLRGDDGADGEYTTNVDGGHPDSVYGGVPIIDGGVI